MSEIPEVFAIFEQKLAHVLSFTIIAQRNNTKQAIEELLAYFSDIVERASRAESRIAELELSGVQIQYMGEDELPANPAFGNYEEREAAWTKLWLKWKARNEL